ncbi:hypothetical protein WJX77_001961 [Trebouxia sp. C0004]
MCTRLESVSTVALSHYEDLFDSLLFDNESYEVQHYCFSGQKVKLLCSASATTDYDLTGQILWPAASMLAGYLAANPAILENCTCACELGAGLGLECRAESGSPQHQVLPDHKGFDVILAADVCYSLKALPALFGVASQLLSRRPGCKFLLGYVSRAYSIDKQILIQAQVDGFAIQEAPDARRNLGGSLEVVVYSLAFQRSNGTHS